MIYLASPYTHEHRSIRYQRFIAVALATAKLMNKGEFIYSPIVHNHTLAELVGLPKKWEYWKDFDTHILIMCTELRVLKLDGWRESTGVTAEIKIAEEIKLPISYMEPVE